MQKEELAAPNLEPLIRQIGESLLTQAKAAEKLTESRRPWETKLLHWCMSNEELKVQIFRFIDVLPSLQSGRDIARHIREYFPSERMHLPKEIKAGLALTKASLLTAPLLKKSAEWLHHRMAALFIGAFTIDEAMKKLDQIEERGLKVSIDLLGELTTSEAEAARYEGQYRALFAKLGGRKKGLDYQNVSIKLTALDPAFDPIDPAGTATRVRKRLIPLLDLAKREDVFVYIDMEHYEVRDLTLRIIQDVLKERADLIPHVGIVLQAYLTDSRASAENILAWAKELEQPLTVRLVRGAYWDTEIMKAEERNWPVPVYLEKSETDRTYEDLTQLFFNAYPAIRLAVATHNVRSIAHAMALIRTQNRDPASLEFQLLYGLGEPLEAAITSQGYAVRLYMPVGDPLPGMAYLVRRLLENVSQQSFLRQSFWEDASAEKLLGISQTESGRRKKKVSRAQSSGGFRNEPALDFSKEDVRLNFEETLKQTKNKLGRKIPLWIDGREIHTASIGLSLNPAWSSEVVAEYSCGTVAHAKDAVESAQRAARAWREQPAEKRAEFLRRTAQILRQKRTALAAIEVYEVGKPWREADGDITEAIDYLEFYAGEAVRMGRAHPTETLTSETSFLLPRPRGVAVVISPWNFPLAILTGMSSAALAAGNTVILKPAEESPLIAWQLAQAYRESGMATGVVNFLTGSGSELGPALTQDPRTAVIAFTGSREAGFDIIRRAAAADSKAARCVKKVITEMGGKNAVIVDESADFDQAVPAVLESAFGYAGQKCSAASRLILLEKIARPFLKRLMDAAPVMAVGDPALAATRVGPLIDASGQQRLRHAYEEAKKTGVILYQGRIGALEDQGYFTAPVIAGSLPKNSPLLQEELFGPFLSVVAAKDFEEALWLANDSDYALTGGVFSRTPSHITRAVEKFEAGNLYINRKITGALVGRQPFGGFRLSGGGSKAGGRNYLREFVNIRTVTENRMRHGFAPLRF